MSPSSVPVDPKLRLRLPRPRVDELQSPQRELTGEYPQALDVYRGLVIRIAGVEVWAQALIRGTDSMTPTRSVASSSRSLRKRTTQLSSRRRRIGSVTEESFVVQGSSAFPPLPRPPAIPLTSNVHVDDAVV